MVSICPGNWLMFLQRGDSMAHSALPTWSPSPPKPSTTKPASSPALPGTSAHWTANFTPSPAWIPRLLFWPSVCRPSPGRVVFKTLTGEFGRLDVLPQVLPGRYLVPLPFRGGVKDPPLAYRAQKTHCTSFPPFAQQKECCFAASVRWSSSEVSCTASVCGHCSASLGKPHRFYILRNLTNAFTGGGNSLP